MNPRYIYRSEQYNCQMNELMFQAGVKGMSERSELIPCTLICMHIVPYLIVHGIYTHMHAYCTLSNSAWYIHSYACMHIVPYLIVHGIYTHMHAYCIPC